MKTSSKVRNGRFPVIIRGNWLIFKLRSSIPKRLYVILAIIPFAFVLLLWSSLSYSGIVKPLFLPSPTAVISALYDLATNGDLLGHIWASTFRVVAGFLLAAILAVPLGILVGTFSFAEAFLEPINDVLRYMPVVAFIPLAILWIGIGDLEKITIIFLGTFFQLIIMVADVVKQVPNAYLDTAYTLGIGKLGVLRRVLFPASLPGIFDNLRVAMGWAWSYLVVAELVAADRGLGFMIIQSQRFLLTGRVIGGILVIGLLGLLFDYAFKFGYKRLFPWALSGAENGK